MHENVHQEAALLWHRRPADSKATWSSVLMAAATKKWSLAVCWLLTLVRWWSPAGGPGER